MQFTVKKEGNGHYTLILEDGEIPQFIQDDGGKLVGNESPPASGWIINGKDCGPYTSVPIYLSLQYVIADIQTKIPQNRGTRPYLADPELESD